MRRTAAIRSALALLAGLAGCSHGHDQAATAADPLDWRKADMCAGVGARDVAALARGPFARQRQDDPERIGCVFVDGTGTDRFAAALVYLGYDPRDLALVSGRRQGPPPAQAWQRQMALDGHLALVVAESGGDCQVVLPLSGEQEGWGIRVEVAPDKPAPQAKACDAHLPLLSKAVHGLPDLLRVAAETTSAPPRPDPDSKLLADSCERFRSAASQASVMLLPLTDSASKPLSPESVQAMSLTTRGAAEGLSDAASAVRRLAARPLPAQLRTELRLYARNADLMREKAQGPLQSGDVYLRLLLAMQVNEAKTLTYCPAP